MKALPIVSHPILAPAAAGAWEQTLLVDEHAEWTAMSRAGDALARAILDDYLEIGGFPADGRLLVLAGKGHNGGDALIAAHALLRQHAGAMVTLVLAFGEASMKPLARRALEELLREGGARVVVEDASNAMAPGRRYALCLDGVFGFQFRAPMTPAIAALLEQVNAYPAIALRAAIDLPSGVGQVSAPTVFHADFTYATGIVKVPVLDESVAQYVGRLRYLDLGFFSAGAPESKRQVLTTGILRPLADLRAAQTDKRTFGHLLIVGGSRSYPGAVMLAARAALRSGAGLVTAFVPAALAPEFAAAQPEVMWVGCPETPAGGLAIETADLVRERAGRASALLIGPGLSAEPAVLATVRAILEATTLPVVVDADALRPELIRLLRMRSFICTPHAGEYARIAGELFVAGAYLPQAGVLVQKGSRTVVTGDGETQYYSFFGGPVLARGGSGDMLAGLIGGLLAQAPANPLLAACRGVVWHGHAADLLARARGQVAVEISELLLQLGPALHS